MLVSQQQPIESRQLLEKDQHFLLEETHEFVIFCLGVPSWLSMMGICFSEAAPWVPSQLCSLVCCHLQLRKQIKTQLCLRKQVFCLLPSRLWENKSKSRKGTECRDLMASPKNHTVRQPYKQSPPCSWTDMTHGKPGSPLWTLVRS